MFLKFWGLKLKVEVWGWVLFGNTLFKTGASSIEPAKRLESWKDWNLSDYLMFIMCFCFLLKKG